VPPIDVEVLVPVFNEAESIEKTIRGIYAELSPLVHPGFIVCEDGSTDNSRDILRKLSEELPMRLNLSNERRGYSRAMREGIEMVEADYLLCMEGDGQCDPSDFVKFWHSRNLADIVIGWRVRRADTLLRRTSSRFFYLLYQAVFRTPVHDPSFSFVLLRKSVAKKLAGELGDMKEGFWWEFVARAHRRGFTFHELVVNHLPRAAGVTRVYKLHRMPGIFLRHTLALFKIWHQTRTAA
jgi:dolichol-phosphate mannosyltransferase